MDALLKSSVLLGTVLLLGAGIFVRWVAPEGLSTRSRWLLTIGASLGALLLFTGSLGNLYETVTRILRGNFDLAVFLDYLFSTRHGQTVSLRFLLGVLLLVWTQRTLVSKRVDRPLYALTGLLLLASISALSHSAMMGTAALLSDFLHLTVTAVWAGSLVYLACLPVWGERAVLTQVVRRVSIIGFLSVATLLATGLFMSTVHLSSLDELRVTPYGQSLSIKLLLVVTTLVLAAANRWVFVPLLLRQQVSFPLKWAVRLESLVLAGVLVATGVLSTTEPPHEHPHEHAGEAHPVGDEPHLHEAAQAHPTPKKMDGS